MTHRLPQWARELLDRHPEAAAPTPPDDPMPAWLEGELARLPLWARIRGTHDVRQHHPFLLIEDVRSQPDLMRHVLELRSELAALAHRLIDQGIRHFVFTGCGSAFHAAQFGSFICRQWTGWTTESHESLEFTNHWRQGHEPTVLILQSATGSSIETLDAARHAADLGVLTVALTNTEGSVLEELCDERVCFPTGQRCGPDVSVLTTRLMMLYLLALEVGVSTGGLNAHEAVELGHAIGQLPEAAAQFLQDEDLNVSQIANALRTRGRYCSWAAARTGSPPVKAR